MSSAWPPTKRSTYTRSIGVPRSKPQLASIGVVRRSSPSFGGRRRRRSTTAARSGPEPTTKRCRHDPPPTRGRNVLFAGSQGRDDSAVGPIVVLSPHSDDGVLSLGASMARWARSGRRVELLTVFALDPASNAPTGGWDRRAGFLTEGDAARARREEDRVACSILGVTPRWLPFGSVDFDRHGDDAEVWDAVGSVVTEHPSCSCPGRRSPIRTMRG